MNPVINDSFYITIWAVFIVCLATAVIKYYTGFLFVARILFIDVIFWTRISCKKLEHSSLSVSLCKEPQVERTTDFSSWSYG